MRARPEVGGATLQETGDLWGAAATLAVGAFASLQWWLSHVQQRRQRDAELMRWGRQVIALMAELESHCRPLRSKAKDAVDFERVEALAAAASALVDEGRLFFSNVHREKAPAGTPRLAAFSGFRPLILDEVLRAYYVARALATRGRTGGDQLREQVWSARGRFVTCLQAEMGASLRRTSHRNMGEEIDPDPTRWGVLIDREHADPAVQP